jgi:hypothetical protein
LDINLNSDIHHTFLYFYLEDHLLLLYILTVANLHARLDGLTSYSTLDMNLDITFNHSQWSIKCKSYNLLLLGCWPTPWDTFACEIKWPYIIQYRTCELGLSHSRMKCRSQWPTFLGKLTYWLKYICTNHVCKTGWFCNHTIPHKWIWT